MTRSPKPVATPGSRPKVVASYQDDNAMLRCPVVSFSGRDDPLVSLDAMASWSDRSLDYLGNHQFPGDHFFLVAERISVITRLVSVLHSVMSG